MPGIMIRENRGIRGLSLKWCIDISSFISHVTSESPGHRDTNSASDVSLYTQNIKRETLDSFLCPYGTVFKSTTPLAVSTIVVPLKHYLQEGAIQVLTYNLTSFSDYRWNQGIPTRTKKLSLVCQHYASV